MDAYKSLAEKAASRSAEPPTGHWVKEAGPISWLGRLATGIGRRAPAAEKALGRFASRGAEAYGRAFKRKPKWTLFGTGAGVGGMNELAGAAGLPNFGGFDPAAHAEKIDPKLTGWRAASNAYLNPIQSVMAAAGLSGQKAPVSMKKPKSQQLGTPTNLRMGPNGQIIGTASQDVDMELSPRMQQALADHQSGNDPLSTLNRGFESAGISPGSLLGGRRPSSNYSSPAAEQAPRLYADPRFLQVKTPDRFSRSAF